MEKRGQFYIISAVIIVGIIVGFIIVRNYAVVEREFEEVYDIGEELKIETGQVYDFGTFKGSEEETDTLIDQWTDAYKDYSQGKAVEDWVLVYGSQEEGVTPITFTSTEVGGITIETGGKPIEYTVTRGEKQKWEKQTVTEEGEVELKFGEFTHKFKLCPGENFFFVIKVGEYTAEG